MNIKYSIFLLSLTTILFCACGNNPASEVSSEAIQTIDGESNSEEATEPASILNEEPNVPEPESVEPSKETEPEVSYHLSDYDFSRDVYGRANLVFYEGNYYFTSKMNNAFDGKLVKLPSATEEPEIITNGVEFLYCVDDVIYTNMYPPSPDSHMRAYDLKTQNLIDDISNGEIGYAGGVLTSDSDYLFYMMYDDDIETNYAVSPLYGSKATKNLVINNFGPVIDEYMEDGVIYFRGTDDEFSDDPECWYKKYEISTETLTDISESDMPSGYIPIEDRGLSQEEIKQYQTLTGSDGSLEAIYHDHIIYSSVKLADGDFITTVQVYDYEGNLLNEIKGAEYGYIGCANDNLLYIDPEEKIQLYPLK